MLKNFTVFPTSKGLFTSVNPSFLEKGALVKADNIVASEGGAGWKKAPGVRRYDVSGITESNPVNAIIDFWYQSGNSKIQKVVAKINDQVFADSGDGVFTDITGSTTLVADDTMTWDVFSNVLVMAFKNSTPLRYNGSGNVAALGGSPPDGNLVRVAKRRLFINDKSSPDRLFITFPGTLDDFDRGDSIDLDEGDSNPSGIEAIFPEMYGDIYVAKRNAIYRLSLLGDSDFFSVIKSVDGVGCISHNSAVAIQGDVIFASDRGIHSLNTTQRFGDVESTFLSASIHDKYINYVDFNRADKMWAVFSPELNSYILVYPRIGSPYVQDAFIYNLINQQWYERPNFNVTAVGRFIDASRYSSSKRRTRILCGFNDGKIGVIDSTLNTKLGAAVTSTIVTGVHFPFGYPLVEVSWKRMNILFAPKGDYNFTITYLVDGNIAGTHTISQSGQSGDELGVDFVLGTSKLGVLGDIKTIGIPLQGKGIGIQFIFTQNADTESDFEEDLEILGYSVIYDDLNMTNLPKVL